MSGESLHIKYTRQRVMPEISHIHVCSILPGYISLFCRLWENLVVLKLNGETVQNC